MPSVPFRVPLVGDRPRIVVLGRQPLFEEAEIVFQDWAARFAIVPRRHSLWLTFPNIAYFPHRLRLLSGKFPVQWVVFPGEHLRFWSVPGFAAWLASLSVPALDVIASNGLTVARLHRVWPNLFGNQMVVRCDR